jgi:L-aminopeptidase/D-esterase-like protein
MATIHLSEIEGFLVGHADNQEFRTGCTAVLCPNGAVASVFIPGYTPGSKDLELLNPRNLVTHIDGLVLAGGSSFGLSTAVGVTNYLRHKNQGFRTRTIKIPVVPAAVIFDYPFNLSPGLLPNEMMGYQAAQNATTGPIKSGPYGAGFSAMCGNLPTDSISSPTGIGSYGISLPNGLKVAAMSVVNPLGSLINHITGEVVSGVRYKDGRLYTREEILEILALTPPDPFHTQHTHTILVVLGTNAKMDKLNAHRLAHIASSGIARTTYPAHLVYDGDVVFALSTNTGPAVDTSYLGALAADVISESILASCTYQLPNEENLPPSRLTKKL